jgi:peptidoglycan hydrolase-like protein with peptidoglycan-binding domain
MRAKLVVTAMAGMAFMAGCAGVQTAQEINRLRADVSLLDQRVGQIERAGLKPSSTAQWPVDAQAPETLPGSTGAIEVARTSSSPSTLKPSKKEIQQALKNASVYQGAIDGKIGPRTREAIREFQRIQGLKVDGIVGRQTWERLSPYLGQFQVDASELNAAEVLK